MPQRPATDSPAYGPLDPLDPHGGQDGVVAHASGPAGAAEPTARSAGPGTVQTAVQTAAQAAALAAARTQNPRLAALIEEAGFSHAGLARRVDQLGLEHGLDLRYDKTSVTRWLRGQQPRGATPALIAEVFTRRLGRRFTAQDIGLDACAPVYAGLEFAETPQEAVDIVASMWRKDSGSQSELRRIAFTPAGLVVPSRDWLIGRTDERVARDGSVPGLTDTGVKPAVPGARQPLPALGRVPVQNRGPAVPGRPPGTEPAEQPGREQRPPLRVGRGDIAAIRAVGDLFRALDQAYGGGHARQALVRYLESEAEPMLRGRYGEQIGRALFGAVADLTRLAGWTSFDIAAHGLAQRYFVQALRLSQAAGDRVLGGYVLTTMSQQAVHLGHGREAIQLARVAQQGVGTAAAPVVQSLMHAAEARGHALMGDVRSCTTALVRCERALAAGRPSDEVPPWARFFDEAQLADEFAHCYRDLQQWRPAAQHAEKSLRLRAPAYARSRIFCRMVLATARLGMGDVDEACAMAAEALRAAGEMRSARTVEYLRDFHRRLAPYRVSQAARAFEEAARQAGVI
ncbi:hypothetical protein GCM10009760_31900 [Kitasatospora kazusensis]|uniref:Sporulation protein n=1 Tax=Kitasatospora kazusensis TaxID=407974 RepID=A0ABN2ZMM5_9ACTN